MKKSGFSMVELVFVIVILGVLGAIAVPIFMATRTDAQVSMLRSDIASTLKAIPKRIFAENIDPTAKKPKGFSNWGEWIMDTGGLDRGKWKPSNMINGIEIIAEIGKSNTKDILCTGEYIIIDNVAGTLVFNPNSINPPVAGVGKTLCEVLKNSYPSGSNRIIPLAATGNVRF